MWNKGLVSRGSQSLCQSKQPRESCWNIFGTSRDGSLSLSSWPANRCTKPGEEESKVYNLNRLLQQSWPHTDLSARSIHGSGTLQTGHHHARFQLRGGDEIHVAGRLWTGKISFLYTITHTMYYHWRGTIPSCHTATPPPQMNAGLLVHLIKHFLPQHFHACREGFLLQTGHLPRRNHNASLTRKLVMRRASYYLNLWSGAELRAKGCTRVMALCRWSSKACGAGCWSIPSCQAWTRAEVTQALLRQH